MNRQTVRLNDQEFQTLKGLSARDRTTISDSIRRLIAQAEIEKSEPVPQLKDRPETLESKSSARPPEVTEMNFAPISQVASLQAEIEKHRAVFAQLLTVLLLILPTDKKQFARSAAEILGLKL